MKLALISDIHGNIPALEAVWQDIEHRKVDKVLCAGDLVAFGPRPDEAVEFIRSRNIPTVSGNHDALVTGRAEMNQFVFKSDDDRHYINDSYTATMKLLTPQHIQHLSTLPEELCLQEASLVITHCVPDMFSAPSTTSLNQFMLNRKERFVFYGHTHCPGLYHLDGGKIAVNLPSLGLPKHGDPLAGYCVAEIASGTLLNLNFVFVDYDRKTVCNDIRQRGFPLQSIQSLLPTR